MRTGSSVRADSSELLPLAGAGRFSATISPPFVLHLWLRRLVLAVALPPLVRFDHLGFVCEDVSICSELTSSEGNTELIWSWVT
jgi:hypothetical protein